MHFEAIIELVWRCAFVPEIKLLRDAFGGRNWAWLVIDLETLIMHTWRPSSTKLGDALKYNDRVKLDEVDCRWAGC